MRPDPFGRLHLEVQQAATVVADDGQADDLADPAANSAVQPFALDGRRVALA